ncbi:MAG: tetratricopeptide repeat protein [Dehalococcoidales bacterium]|nr:tetratricopeptide repeat protein [Dehalococcoidales bacterium]
MTSGEEKLLRQKQQRSKEAIDLAMQGQWREAVEANKSLIKDFPEDVEAYNRLGRAYVELGEYARAKEAYHQTIKLDPFNAIARKNLSRLSYVKETAATVEPHKVEPQHFIEEIGKAGAVNLHGLAPKGVLARMVAGDSVNLKIKGTSLKVENNPGEHLGDVDPRHATRLIKLMDGGNKYTAAVVSSTENSMTVIIREVYQDPSQAGRLSFPPRDLQEVRPYHTDRIIKLEEEDEDEAGYTVIGGEEGVEALPREASSDNDEDTINNEI